MQTGWPTKLTNVGGQSRKGCFCPFDLKMRMFRCVPLFTFVLQPGAAALFVFASFRHLQRTSKLAGRAECWRLRTC